VKLGRKGRNLKEGGSPLEKRGGRILISFFLPERPVVRWAAGPGGVKK